MKLLELLVTFLMFLKHAHDEGVNSWIYQPDHLLWNGGYGAAPSKENLAGLPFGNVILVITDIVTITSNKLQ